MRIATALVAATTVLALSDEAFSVRLGGMNFRAAQGVLLVVSVAFLVRERGRLALPRAAVLCAGGFVAASLVTALLAADPRATLLRTAWFAFNAGTAALFALWAARRAALVCGVAAGVAAVAAVVWVDCLFLHWAESGPLLGGVSEGRGTSRPTAFHYEPSYAAGALVLGLAFTLHPGISNRRLAIGAGALVASAIFLTSSRSGSVALAAATLAACLAAVAPRGRPFLREWGAALLVGACLVGLFALDEGGRRHLRAIAGPLGPQSSVDRVAAGVPSSETDRLASYRAGLARWRDAPLFGSGAAADPDAGRALDPGSISGWIGLLVEAGLVGAALWAGIWVAAWRGFRVREGPAAPWLAAVLAAHFGVSLVLGPSFVRLDYWVLGAAALVASAAVLGPKGAWPARRRDA